MHFLAEPALEYQKSYLEALHETQLAGARLFEDTQAIAANFPSYLQQLSEERKPSRSAPQRVPCSTFWLVDDDEFIGWLSLRHELRGYLMMVAGHIGYVIRPSRRRKGYGYEILRLGLQQARLLGLSRVLLTCDEDNIASKKIIERQGGQFENALEFEDTEIRKLRYWITLS